MRREAEKDGGWKERKSTKSNGFEEHDSNQFLILAGKKRRRGRKEKKKEKEEWGAST